MTKSVRPLGVTLIVMVNSVAALITLAFWALVWQRLFASDALRATMERSAVASTLGFLVADLIWAVPLLIISIPGLWKMRGWGWLAAQMANILWLYSLTALFVRDRYSGSVSPGIVIFLPFALFAIWATIYLWQRRREVAL